MGRSVYAMGGGWFVVSVHVFTKGVGWVIF